MGLPRQTNLLLLRKLFGIRILRFLLVGGLNSLFGFTVFSLIACLGGRTWQAILGGNLAGILFNFFTIGGVVFRDLSLRRLPFFVFAYILLLVLNIESISLLTSVCQIDRITAQAFLTVPLAILSFFVMSKFVFSHP
jgi:putative flippase GtrA